jgi:anti-anti-sigma factor
MCHSGLRVLPPETPYLIPAGSGPPSGPDDALTLVVRHQPKYVLVTAVGEIDMATVAQWRERLRVLAASGCPVVADLDQVSFMDAAGLGILAGAAGLAAEHGGRLHVVCARPRIRWLFQVTGLDRSIPLARTLPEALLAVAASPAEQLA